MKTRILALLVALVSFFTIFVTVSPAANAAVRTDSCYAGGRRFNTDASYTQYLDGSGRWRAKLSYVTSYPSSGTSAYTVYRSMETLTGQAWSAGTVTVTGSGNTVYPPSSANALLSNQPYVFSRHSYGGVTCAVRINLYG